MNSFSANKQIKPIYVLI